MMITSKYKFTTSYRFHHNPRINFYSLIIFAILIDNSVNFIAKYYSIKVFTQLKREIKKDREEYKNREKILAQKV